MKPTAFPLLISDARPAVAIFHASQSRNAAPHQFNTLRSVGWLMTSWPRPSALQNSNDPIPTDAPSAQGKPRHTPAADPVATIIVLLGPGVIAATILKIRKAI